MAAPNQPHPLQVLDQMFKEVLVQTGKSLMASRKDGPKNIAGAGGAVQTKTTDSLTAYQYALDDLESEITRAKAVVLRDLEKLRAARAPAPAPAPAPVPQPVAPPAPMMELPSSAAHTISAPAFAPKKEIKTAAPFPDMGMGMSSEVVDLTTNDKKSSPRVPAGAIRPPVKATPPIRNEVKPSPKQTPKPAPKPTPKPSQPPKVTPVPLPQIPRPQPPQQPTAGPMAAAKPQPTVPSPQMVRQAQPAPAAPPAQDAMMMPINATAGMDSTGGNGPNFTDMRFSLAQPSSDAQAAPPAPNPEFAPQEAGKDMMSLDNSRPGNNNNTATNGQSTNTTSQQQQQPKEQDKNDSNLDDLFNLGDANSADGMFDLGGGGVNDSTFDDMMFFDNNNDAEMAQFDEAYFLP